MRYKIKEGEYDYLREEMMSLQRQRLTIIGFTTAGVLAIIGWIAADVQLDWKLSASLPGVLLAASTGLLIISNRRLTIISSYLVVFHESAWHGHLTKFDEGTGIWRTSNAVAGLHTVLMLIGVVVSSNTAKIVSLCSVLKLGTGWLLIASATSLVLALVRLGRSYKKDEFIQQWRAIKEKARSQK